MMMMMMGAAGLEPPTSRLCSDGVLAFLMPEMPATGVVVGLDRSVPISAFAVFSAGFCTLEPLKVQLKSAGSGQGPSKAAGMTAMPSGRR